MSITNPISIEDEKLLSEKYKGKSVLVVEDEYISSQLICRILNKYLKVDVAVTAEECFVKISKSDYNLIFMDINLGYGISGLEAVKQIRGIEIYSNTPIVTTTAFATTGDEKKFLEAGCTEYLSKPFTKDKLLNLLKGIKI